MSKRVLITGGAGPDCISLQATIQAVLEGVLDPAPLLTHRLLLEQLPRAFELMRTRPAGFLKAVIFL